MTETSVIELSKKALKTNLKFIRNIIGPNAEFVSVVKGNAYGHGINTFGSLAFNCGVRSFAVFSANEAKKLLSSNIEPDRIMIMGYISDEDIAWVIENDVDFFVFELERLSKAIDVAKALNKKVHIHVEIETGMGRTGFQKNQWKELVGLIKKERKDVVVEGICTHLAGAEDISNYLRIRNQIQVFNDARKFFDKHNIRYKKTHAACSAAIINYPKTIFNLVRVGIMQYGFWPSKEVKMAYFTKSNEHTDPLKRVISWKTEIMDVVDIKAGQYIGYGRSYLAESDMKVAIVPVGYAHGYSRVLSNLGKAIINGVRVSTVGTVNMNMASFDVTNVPQVTAGDSVTLIGEQNGVEISVSSFSDLSDQLNYELLTRLPASIPRSILK